MGDSIPPTVSPFENTIAEGINGQKKKILWYLNVMQQAGLEELANTMKISRMGAHKHLADLQKRGLLEAFESSTGVGRPRMIYKLSSKVKQFFQNPMRLLQLIHLISLRKIWVKMGL